MNTTTQQQPVVNEEEKPIDIVLVRPRDIGSVPLGSPVQDPLGVGYLASTLRQKGRNVLIIDAHSLEIDNQGILIYLQHLQPAVVALSLHSFADYKHCVELSEGLCKFSKKPYCIWGGEHATFQAEKILEQHLEVDAVALGEGEETIDELLKEVLSMGQPTAPIAGLIFRDDEGAFIKGEFRGSVANLDDIPNPHKDIVETALRMGKHVSLSILSGRGCTHDCSFCTAHDFMRLGGGRVWRRRSAKLVADELEQLHKRYMHHPLVHPVIQFQDVIFLGTTKQSKRWIEEYVTELEQREIAVPFYCMARADAIIANEEMLPRLVKVGLWSVEMGLEAGVDRILQNYNKRNSVGENEKAVSLLRKHGVTFDASGYIMFDPYMTLDELRQNAAYLTKFGAATWEFYVTRLQLYPGTRIREQMIREGLYDGEDDIGRTSGYQFVDPLVQQVADSVYYYDMIIRTLDLRLRDAKALIANSVRVGTTPDPIVQKAIDLAHNTYYEHLIKMTDLAASGELESQLQVYIDRFLSKVRTLIELLTELLAPKELVGEVGR